MNDRLEKKVLLTGATGRVGARFIPLLRQQGAQLRLAVWNPDPAVVGPANPNLVMGDLTDPQTCRRAVEGMDAIVHIASAFMGVTAPEAEDLNYRATAQLTAAAAEAGVQQFVQMSSYLIYLPTPGRPTREDDPLRPADKAPFSAAKLGSERAVAAHMGSNLKISVLRVAFTYGEGDPHLVDAFAWAKRTSGDQRLHLVHHADVRQSVLAALQSGAVGAFNIADDTPMLASELSEVAQGYASLHQESADARELMAAGGDDLAVEVDTNAARTVLGFKPAFASIWAAKEAGAM